MKLQSASNTKRGSGKIKGSLGINSLYKYYKTNTKNPVERKLFTSFIKDLNKIIINRILDAEDFRMPYRLGVLNIRKFEQNLHKKPKNKWPVNYQLSKELGYIVYHVHDYAYRWYWNKNKAVVKWKSVYKFEPSRTSARQIAYCVKKLKKDYFT